MPIYEYRCQACEKVTEAMQKFSDAPLADCEKCGAKGTLSKLMSLSSFALKGSGWYTTDYKRAGKSGSSGSSGEAPSSSDSSAKKTDGGGSGTSGASGSSSTSSGGGTTI